MGKTTVVVGLVLSLYCAVCVWTHWDTFSITYPVTEYARKYSQSQYVLGENKTEVMGDGDIYAYAGIRYIQGEDPTKINFEHPPFTKYLYGISYVLTGRPNWILVPLFFLAGFAFWYLTGEVVSLLWLRWLALGLFLGHSTIYATIFRTMLDFPATTWLLATLAMYTKVIKQPTLRHIILFGVSGGLLLASQYPVPVLLSLIGLLVISLAIHRVRVSYLGMAIVIIISTYLATYTGYFLHGHSFIEYLKFEWWRLHWFMGKVAAPKGLLWQTIFTGKYPRWWEGGHTYTTASHWTIMWPLTVVLYCISWIKWQMNQSLFAYKLWIVIALAAFSMGVAEDRFLIPLIPGFALFGVAFIEQIIKKASKHI